MIVFPEDWRQIGQNIPLADIDGALRSVIDEIDCSNLSYSGGIDSSLLLYYLLEAHRKVNIYTVVNDVSHPDLTYAEKGVEYFRGRYGVEISHTVYIMPDCEGNELVRRYYDKLATECSSIIAGDGIDELACGYYAHQSNPDDATYHALLSNWQQNHAQPLHENSGLVKVYLPYVAPQIANLFYRMPFADKVNNDGRKLVIKALSQGKMPSGIIERRKYGMGTSFKGNNYATT